MDSDRVERNAVFMEGWPGRYVAVGDSWSAGLDTDESFPWPHGLANRLRRHSPDLEYRNLAVVGATSEEIVADQLPLVVSGDAGLITLTCGSNDVLARVAPDVDGARRNLRVLLTTLREEVPGATVAILTYGDFTPYMPFRERSRERVRRGIAALNDVIRELASELDCVCVDVDASPLSKRADSYGEDGIHASTVGHLRSARMVYAALQEHAREPVA